MKLTYSFLITADKTSITVFYFHVLNEPTAFLNDKLSTFCGKRIAPFVKLVGRFCQITGVIRIFF